MVEPLATGLLGGTLAAGLWALVLVVLNRGLSAALLGFLALLEVGLLVQAAVGIAQVIGTDRVLNAPTFVGYLLGTLLLLPAGVLWALTERSRYGPAVLAVTCFALPVMIARLQQLWSAVGG